MFGKAPLRLARERGQVLALFAVLIAVIGGFAAIAVDLGSYSAERRDLQNAADAIALAASLELPDATAAQSAADEWATKNGVDLDSMDVTVIPQSIPSEPNPKVRVEVEREHDFTFARLVGISSADVGASSSAIKTSAAGGDGVIPLSVTEEVLAGAVLGDLVTLKYDANDISQGNTSPIRIDGSGTGNCNNSDAYCDGVKYGSDNAVCADGTNTTYCTGPSHVDTQPGNVVGGTRNAIDYRLDNTDSHCDEFTETFEDDPTTTQQGVYRITPECNPFINGSYASHRVIIIPVINELCNGSCDVTILEFGLFFLEGYAPDCGNGNGNGGGGASGHRPDHDPPGHATNTPTAVPNTPTPGPTPSPTPCADSGNGSQSCTGTECEVMGRFVRVNQNVGLLAGTFNASSYNQFVRLVQ